MPTAVVDDVKVVEVVKISPGLLPMA